MTRVVHIHENIYIYLFRLILSNSSTVMVFRPVEPLVQW